MLDCDKVGCAVDCCVRKFYLLNQIFLMKETGYRRWLNHVRGSFQSFLPKFHCELNFIKIIWGYIPPAQRKKFKYRFEDRGTVIGSCLWKSYSRLLHEAVQES